MKITKTVKKPVFILLLSIAIFSTGITQVSATSYDSNWFDSLQKAISTDDYKENPQILDEIVITAIDSGAQMYVIIQTATAMDSTVASLMIQSIIRVTNNPEKVVKASVISNIDLGIILNAGFEVSDNTEGIIMACIAAGSDLESLISECIKAEADPVVTIGATITATNNISSVISAAKDAGVSSVNITKAVFKDNTKVEQAQAVAACIELGIPVDIVIDSAVAAGANPRMVINVSLYTSDNYQLVVNAALNAKITKSEIADFTIDSDAIDHEALRIILETSEAITAYTPIESRSNPKNSIGTETNGGSVSPH